MPDLTKKTTIRKGVMIPCFAFMAFIIVLGIFKNDWLKTICKSAFRFSLINFGWAYQLVAMASLVCVAVVTFSKIGNLRIGGPNARPKYSFKTWFAMALTGGISVGIVNWGVNEPMVYFGNVYGELELLGIAPQSAEAYRFALGRCFYNWTFVPYAFYGITGLLMAYLFFNKKSKFSVAATLKPVLGKHADKPGVAAVADTLCSIGIVLGMACGLGTGLSFIISGLKVVYGLETGIPTWVILGLATTAIFTGAAYLGIDKGVKKLASFNSKIFYNMCANGLTVTVQQVYSVNWMLMLTFIPGIIYIWFRYRKPREYKNVDVDLSAYNAVESTKLELRHWISIAAVLVVTAVEFKTQSLAVAALAGLVIMFFSGAVKWKDIEERFNDGIRMMGSIAFIMLVAGGFGMVMRATGGVNALVERSASALSSSHLLAATVITLIGLVVTMGIGTSFGTIPVIAVLFVPLCTKLGFSPAATILMISSAAALGDAGSPASDATLGPTCGLNADGQHDHIWDTCVPTFGALNIPLMIGTIIIAQFI